ncbi:hypothetical protein Rifp1Sym_fg00010 [endosymbiont of Riftia pachyptila (vent Ph05)]|uniref:Uncharacterized protein n=1 Tax=endosymbiont of Riftia pachyptila (vent Ph05) TaxID=1048808 RepID=G2DHK1_9GAMM|nr:hypothetical protein Rifp1Sym_fg00010 [endosymbiont of Riftia pachyptila (vent Ph05)]
MLSTVVLAIMTTVIEIHLLDRRIKSLIEKVQEL